MTSTALVPIMDTQVLDICRRLGHDPVSKTAQHIASIKATISNLSIEGAVSILDAFDYANDVIYHRGNKWNVRDIMNEQYFPFHQGRMAHETVIFWFWGGPPVKLSWYQGTLQTLLEDRVLYEIGVQGVTTIAKMIGTDLEAINVPTYSTTRIFGC